VYNYPFYNYATSKREGAQRALAFNGMGGLGVVVMCPGSMLGPYDFTLQFGRLFFDLRDGKVKLREIADEPPLFALSACPYAGYGPRRGRKHATQQQCCRSRASYMDSRCASHIASLPHAWTAGARSRFQYLHHALATSCSPLQILILCIFYLDHGLAIFDEHNRLFLGAHLPLRRVLLWPRR